MSNYILLYQYVENYLEARTPYRPEHIEKIKAHVARGQILMAGAFANPADGAVIVFKTDDKSVIEKFVEDDPYQQNGVVTGWSIHEWTLAIGGERLD